MSNLVAPLFSWLFAVLAVTAAFYLVCRATDWLFDPAKRRRRMLRVVKQMTARNS